MKIKSRIFATRRDLDSRASENLLNYKEIYFIDDENIFVRANSKNTYEIIGGGGSNAPGIVTVYQNDNATINGDNDNTVIFLNSVSPQYFNISNIPEDKVLNVVIVNQTVSTINNLTFTGYYLPGNTMYYVRQNTINLANSSSVKIKIFRKANVFYAIASAVVSLGNQGYNSEEMY